MIIKKLLNAHPIKVLQILPSLGTQGGIERYVLDLPPLFKLKNIPVFVASEAGTLTSKLLERGGIHEAGPYHSKNPFTIIKNVFSLERIIQKHKIDLIHVHSRAPCISTALLSKKTGIPYIATYHAIYKSQTRLKKFYNSFMVRGKAVIAISDFIKDHIQNAYPEIQPQIKLIREGIDTDHFNRAFLDKNINLEKAKEIIKGLLFRKNNSLTPFSSLSPFPSFILFPSRFTPIKRHHFFLDALSLLNTWEHPFIVLCIGDQVNKASYVKEVEAYARKVIHNKNHHILLHEAVFDVRPFYYLADIIVSCSPEAYGRTTAEALSFENLFIGLDNSATRELAIHGTLINTEQECAQAIKRLLTLPYEERSRITTQSRTHIEKHYSLKTMSEKLFALYEEIIFGIHKIG